MEPSSCPTLSVTVLSGLPGSVQPEIVRQLRAGLGGSAQCAVIVDGPTGTSSAEAASDSDEFELRRDEGIEDAIRRAAAPRPHGGEEGRRHTHALVLNARPQDPAQIMADLLAMAAEPASDPPSSPAVIVNAFVTVTDAATLLPDLQGSQLLKVGLGRHDS